MNTNGKVFRNLFVAPRAYLACPLGRHFYYLTLSFCRFSLQNRKEVKPCYISHRPIETSKSFPTLKLLYVNSIIFFKQLLGDLKMKVFSLVKNFLVCLCYKHPCPVSSVRALELSGKCLLPGFEKVLGLLKKAGVAYLSIVRICQKRFATHVYANLLSRFKQWFGGNIVAGETDKPFAGRVFSDSYGFNVTFNGSMKNYLKSTNFGDGKVFSFKPPSCLFKGKTIIPIISLKSRIAHFFTGLDPSKESLKGPIHSLYYVLKALGGDFIEFGKGLFKVGELFLLSVGSDGLLVEFPDIPSLLKAKIVENAAEVKNFLGFGKGILIGFNSVFKSFLHFVSLKRILSQKRSFVKKNQRLISPLLKQRVLRR